MSVAKGGVALGGWPVEPALKKSAVRQSPSWEGLCRYKQQGGAWSQLCVGGQAEVLPRKDFASGSSQRDRIVEPALDYQP